MIFIIILFKNIIKEEKNTKFNLNTNKNLFGIFNSIENDEEFTVFQTWFLIGIVFSGIILFSIFLIIIIYYYNK